MQIPALRHSHNAVHNCQSARGPVFGKFINCLCGARQSPYKGNVQRDCQTPAAAQEPQNIRNGYQRIPRLGCSHNSSAYFGQFAQSPSPERQYA